MTGSADTEWEAHDFSRGSTSHDALGIAEVLARYDGYPPAVRQKKLHAGWFYGSGDVFDARQAERRGDAVVQRCAATRAVEQFAALAYVLRERFPPYRKWRFRDIPLELPGIETAHTGDTDALATLATAVESHLRPHLSHDRIDEPYLHPPAFDRLG
ncbi:MAG: DUF4037 domain-containing protein [Halobacteriaceae archaeon]